MPLLSEYALVPDVFDSTSYSSDEVGSIRLQQLKEVLLSEGLVRDLRDGRWSALFSNHDRQWHQRGKELLKKLIQQKRLYPSKPALTDEPLTDHAWCEEALASHADMQLEGIITTMRVADGFPQEPLVGCIDQLHSAPWWQARSSSSRLVRTTVEYKQHLQLVLQCANSIFFIDPHLDPSQLRYREFIELLRMAAGRSPVPLIEVHRVCYTGSGRNRIVIASKDWEVRFTDAWSGILRASGLTVEIFIWDDFHDRYVITDLVGISVPNGFDTTTSTSGVTTWTRLGREGRDDVQREFDPACNRHVLHHRFIVP